MGTEGAASTPRTSRKRIAVAAGTVWVLLTVVALVLAIVAIADHGEPGPRGPRGVAGERGVQGPQGPPVAEDDDVVVDLQLQLAEANRTIDCLSDNVQRLEDWANSLSVQESVFRVYLRRC
jgi:hypothetical protein